MKQCSSCGTKKSRHQFSKQPGKKLQSSICRSCKNKKPTKEAKAVYQKTLATIRDLRVITKKFGLTEEDYFRMEKEQRGVCAICKAPCTSGRRLAVDHNHTTGKVRGLLCLRCNFGIGYFEENLNIIGNAMKYLRKHNL
jgi:hypothetical protein